MRSQHSSQIDLTGWPSEVRAVLERALEMRLPVLTSRDGTELRATLAAKRGLADPASSAGFKNLEADVWQWTGKAQTEDNPSSSKGQGKPTRISGIGDKKLTKQINRRLEDLDDLLRETKR